MSDALKATIAALMEVQVIMLNHLSPIGRKQALEEIEARAQQAKGEHYAGTLKLLLGALKNEQPPPT